MKNLLGVFLFFHALASGIFPQQPNEGALRLVVLDSIKVTGSRLPEKSVVRLSGLKVGDKVNDLIVNTACHKITSTGLVKSVDYAYDLYPDRPSVGLMLTLTDEVPLLPAHIKPLEQEEHLWQSLAAIDPLYPRTSPHRKGAQLLREQRWQRPEARRPP